MKVFEFSKGNNQLCFTCSAPKPPHPPLPLTPDVSDQEQQFSCRTALLSGWNHPPGLGQGISLHFQNKFHKE